MLDSKLIDSRIFRRLTGRGSPKLHHPTSADYDPLMWLAVSRERDGTLRDATLALTAVVIGTDLSQLRTNVIDKLFRGLTDAQIVTFAIADANRAWAIMRTKGLEALNSDDGVAYPSIAGNVELNAGPFMSDIGADDLNTVVIDSLPHWLFQAAKAGDQAAPGTFDYSAVGRIAQATLSLEHALKEVWQQVLWQDWSIHSSNTAFVVEPNNRADQGLWRVWAWREQSLISQHAFLNRHNEGAVPPDELPRVLDRTATAVTWDGETFRVVIGPPHPKTAEHHRSALEFLESSYLEPFLDMPLKDKAGLITARNLERAVCVFRDIAELALPIGADVEYATQVDVDRLSCALSVEHSVGILSEALGFDSGVAAECIDRLTSRPLDNIGPIFRNGLWHRPLVASRDGNTIQLVLGALVWGSPVLRAERWLQEDVRGDLSKTPLGLLYETHIRERLSAALAKNELLASISSTVVSVGHGQAEEEIDGLLRIGSTVLVLEMKCLLAPHEPIERHNYVVKLERAAAQVVRKAKWLAKNREEIARRVGKAHSGKPFRIVPLVVVNQSNGTGCKFGESVVIDAHFLELYLAGGSYQSSGAMHLKTPGRTTFRGTHLYSSASEAASRIPDVFAQHPGLENFKAVLDWDFVSIPLREKEISMAMSRMNVDKYKSHLSRSVQVPKLT